MKPHCWSLLTTMGVDSKLQSQPNPQNQLDLKKVHLNRKREEIFKISSSALCALLRCVRLSLRGIAAATAGNLLILNLAAAEPNRQEVLHLERKSKCNDENISFVFLFCKNIIKKFRAYFSTVSCSEILMLIPVSVSFNGCCCCCCCWWWNDND